MYSDETLTNPDKTRPCNAVHNFYFIFVPFRPPVNYSVLHTGNLCLTIITFDAFPAIDLLSQRHFKCFIAWKHLHLCSYL